MKIRVGCRSDPYGICHSSLLRPLGRRLSIVRLLPLLLLHIGSGCYIIPRALLLLAAPSVAASFALYSAPSFATPINPLRSSRETALLSSRFGGGGTERAAAADEDPSPTRAAASTIAGMDPAGSNANAAKDEATSAAKLTSSSTVVVDRSTLTLLEHVNLNIPVHEPSLTFYYHVLGCGMDPRKADNLLTPGGKATVWANCGASQFHLPKGEVAQVIPGSVGLRYDSLEPLKERLSKMAHEDPAVVQSYEVAKDRYGGETVRVVDHYGNAFVCRGGGNPVSDRSWRQPVIRSSEVDRWGWVAEKYGCRTEDTECRGIDFVEFYCPVGSADKIALFYDSVFDATTSVVEQGGDDDDDARKIAIVAFGNVDATGRADQSLLFRETTNEIPKYDGHHVALYVGQSQSDFEQAFKNCDQAGVVWVNPRFDDKASNLQGAKRYMQFRFKNIVDMETGEPVFELEHEVRSVKHTAWPGAKEEQLNEEE
jgi:hypothetical protein